MLRVRATVFLSLLPIFILAQAPKAASVTGQVTVSERAATVPQSLMMRLQARSGNAELREVQCNLDLERFTCSVPQQLIAAGQVVNDVEFYVSGFAPVYRWDVSLSSDSPLNVGTVAFQRGGTISGKVTAEGFGLGGVNVELSMTASGQDDARRSRLRARRATTDRQGIFTFADIPSGRYTVQAQREGFSVATRPAVVVDAPNQVGLEPLVLKPLSALRIYITPPVDYQGEPWRIQLDRAVSAQYFQSVRSGATDVAGHWSATLLDAGMYRVRVVTTGGVRVMNQEVRVEEDAVVNMTIPAIPIVGTLRVGGEPTGGSVTLTWTDGTSQAFKANEEGEFSGIVPHQGDWRGTMRFGSPLNEVSIEVIEIRKRSDQAAARVDIDLPAGTIKGRVVDELGDPVPAIVFLYRDGIREGSVRSDPNGEFVFKGLAEGEREAIASAKEATSGKLPVRVTEGDTQEITLVVRPTTNVVGLLLDPAGNAVAGASVRIVSRSFAPQNALSGLTGRFEFVLPTRAGAGLLIVAPGFARKFVSFQSTTDNAHETLTVSLSPVSGKLLLRMRQGAPPWPFLSRDGFSFFPIPHLFQVQAAGSLQEATDDGLLFDLEPGNYTLCPTDLVSDRCVTKTVEPGRPTAVVWPTEKGTSDDD